ncbi:MAG: hypothetical protein IH946_08960, partial [Bacteroidetes bacterium]|nr:hypothetical protein [Bacteroidota bacterium]
MKTIPTCCFILAMNFSLLALPGLLDERMDLLEKKLTELGATSVPGLNETVDISVSGVSIQEFLRGIAETNNLNISIDPA